MMGGLAAFALVVVAQAGPVNDQLSAYGLKLNGDTAWSITKNSQGMAGDKRLRTLEIKRADYTMTLTFMSALTNYQVEQESKTEYASILGAYKAALTPYAGAVSRKLACDREFIPKDVRSEFAGQRARILLGYATERKTYGVCNVDEAKNEFAFLAAVLPGEHLVKLSAFRKKKGASLDVGSWKKQLAEFKLTAAKSGGSRVTKSP